MPQAIAEDRERGVLKRVHASPMPAWVLVVGRMVGAVVVVLVTGLAIVVLAAALYRPGMPPGMPAAVVTLVLTAVCFALVGVAVTTFIGSAQSVVAVTLGTMLPLAFISDIFVIGATLPPALDVVSWVFPLRHAANAMTEAVAPDVVGSGLAWGHLAVLLAWTVAASVVVVLRFRWEADEPRRPRAAAMTPAAARR
jgi:ABC-type multidrug transport system permease subunit